MESGLCYFAPRHLLVADIRDENGRLSGTVVVFTDITERKQAEVEMERINQQLREISRKAGMAEVATNVLHNVGNVLHSVNVSASLAQGLLRDSKITSLARTADLLREHGSDLGAFLTADAKGRLVPDFIVQLTGLIESEHKELRNELSSLTQNIEHINGIVAMQQNYARVSSMIETLAPMSLMEDALRLNEAGLIRHGVRASREFDEVPPVTADRHKVLQILVNLIANAKYAVGAATTPDKLITLRVRQSALDRVQLQVTDNGIGIAPENLTRVFNHGFTTKTNGHGFGLHSGANAAKEMGGQLIAHSSGLNQGATFTLELPVASNRNISCNSLTEAKTAASW